MKIVNVEGENLHIFWTVWRISMPFTVKMWLMIILKNHKNPGLRPFLKTYILGKNTGGRGGRGACQIDPPPAFKSQMIFSGT